MSAMNPVRELDPGARPRDWMDGAFSANDASEHFNDGPAPPEHAPARAEGVRTSAKPAPARVNTVTASAKPAPATPTRGEPQRYKVQFEASEEYVELVERAKALLSHTTPRADLSELHLRAMRVLVAALERQKYAVLQVCERLRGALPGDGAARATSLARVRAGRRASPGKRHAPLPRPQHPRRRTGFRKGLRRACSRLDPARALERSRCRIRRCDAEGVQMGRRGSHLGVASKLERQDQNYTVT
jgi:hypothetical protein